MNSNRSFAARILKLVGFGLLAFAVTVVAGGLWSALLLINLHISPSVPWAVPVMAFLLWLIWSYLDGKGWPQKTSVARHRYLRANRRSARIVIWSLVAGVLSVIALAGLWIVLFRLIPMPPNALSDMSRYPRLTVALMILMGSLVSPFMEEASFRGYFQVALERDFSATIGVTVSSLIFALAHFSQGFFWPKLLVYFLVGLAFGATAYLTNSTLPAIAPHIIGDLTFFTLIWPHDAGRTLVTITGVDNWLWIHLAQAVLFAVLAIWAFLHLAKLSRQEGLRVAAQSP
jgi:membrane protease YdiL (CAAX protease family)